MMNHNKENNGFEDFIKNSIENYEVEYNPNHWSEMEQMLDNAPSGSINKGNWFTSSGIKLTAVIGLITGCLILYYSNNTKNEPLSTENANSRQILLKNKSTNSKNTSEISVDILWKNDGCLFKIY